MASKYLSLDLGTRNWSDATGTWVTTNGGSTPIAAPTSGDVAFLTSASGNVVIDVTSVCTTLNMTGYTATMSGSAQLTVAGAITLGGIITATGLLRQTAAGTITTNGLTWPGAVTITGTGTRTLAGNLGVGGLLTLSVTSFGGLYTVTVAGGLLMTANCSASPTIRLTSGTWSATTADNGISKVILAGDVTISTVVSLYGGGSITYESGNITTTGSTLYLQGVSTFNTSTVHWNNIKCNWTNAGNQNFTRLSDLYIDGDLSFLGSNTVVSMGTGNYNIYLSGNFIGPTSGIGGIASGVGTLIFNGNNITVGDMSGGATIYLNINTVFNTTGTISFGGRITVNTRTYTHISGTFIPGTSVFACYTATLDLHNNIIGILTSTVNTSITLLSDLRCVGIETNGFTITFNGSANINTGYIKEYKGGALYIPSGYTLTIANFIYFSGVYNAPAVIASSTPGAQAYLVYLSGYSNNMIFNTNLTDIDASGSSVKIYTYYGTITNCVYVKAVTAANFGGGCITVTTI